MNIKLTVEKAIESETKRFERKLIKKGPDECWPWNGWHNDRGYPMLDVSHPTKRKIRASRYAYTYFTGIPVPKEMNILHKCDNPACLNPAHLFLGTQQDNIADCKAKGRIGFSSILNTDQVKIIVERLCKGEHPRTIAPDFGVNHMTIRDIQTGDCWRTVSTEEQRAAMLENRATLLKLNSVTVREMDRLYREHGMTPDEIADRFDVTPRHVRDIINRKRWGHLFV